MNRSLVLIKLGGSLITDKTKPMKANKNLIIRLGSELTEIKSNHRLDMIVGSGAGSFGHYLVKKNNMARSGSLAGKEQAVEEIHQAVSQLNSMLHKAIGFGSEQFEGRAIKMNIDRINNALADGRVVSTYGDILAEKGKYKVVSTEEIFELLLESLASKYEKIHVIFATSVTGVLDRTRRAIPSIKAEDVKKLAWQSQKGYDVTGGMRQKVEASVRMLKRASSVQIIDGRLPGNIERALSGKNIGTLIK